VGSARQKAATYTQNKRTQTSVSSVGFESTIQVFERAKIVHALDRAAIVDRRSGEIATRNVCVFAELGEVVLTAVRMRTFPTSCFSCSC
jgi:hypothetical protein